MSTFSESVLRLYKRFISPQLPAQCRFIPSCSEYATEAVLQHGMLRGSALEVGYRHTLLGRVHRGAG